MPDALLGSLMSPEGLLAVFAVALAAVAGWLGILWQARLPSAGIAVLLILAILWPVDLPGGLPAPVALTALLCVTWLLQALVLRRHLALQRSGLVAATLAFMAVSVIAFIVGQYQWFPTAHAPMRAQVGGLALFLLSGGLTLLVGHQVSSLRQLERLTWLFVGLGGAFVLSQVAPLGPAGTLLSALTHDRTVGSLFWVWFVATSLSQALFNVELRRSSRVALGLVAAAALWRGVGLAFSWVSGWLPPLVAAGVILLVRFPRATIGSALLMTAPALALADEGIRALMVGEAYSWTTRLEAIRVMGHVIERNPWLGFGPANYYHYTLLFPILGWWVRFNSHNNYLDLVAQTGIVGLAAFGWILFETLRLALALGWRAHRPFSRAYVVGALGGLAGSAVTAALGDWVVPFIYNVGFDGFRSSLLFWFFAGGLLVLRAAHGRPAAWLAPSLADPWAKVEGPAAPGYTRAARC